MNIDLNIISQNAAVIVPVVIALVQSVKMTGWVKDHFAPLVSIVFGIALAFVSHSPSVTLNTTIMSGVIYGLMSSGLYSGVKTTMVANVRLKDIRAKERAREYNER